MFTYDLDAKFTLAALDTSEGTLQLRIGNKTLNNKLGGFFPRHDSLIPYEYVNAAAIQAALNQKPMLVGELKALWMRATGLLPAAVSQELSMEILLSENFWRDADSNRWREPTDEEREKMNDDRSIRVLHDADRYVGGSLHRTTTGVERCQWIDILFQACRQVEDGDMHSAPALRGFKADEAYRVITWLFQSILREQVPADAYSLIQHQSALLVLKPTAPLDDFNDLVGRGEVQLLGQRSLQILLEKLTMPAIAELEGHVYPMTIILGHGRIIGEQTTKTIRITPCRGEGKRSAPVHKTFRMNANMSNCKTALEICGFCDIV
ncbi:MAG: hypothetical protein WCF30_20850 [Terracidiphilus sp.]